MQAGDGTIEGGHGLAGASARDLGRQLQAARCVTRRVEASTERGGKEMKPAEVSTPSDREVLVKRTFDAPVNLVWQADTEPALMRRWVAGGAGGAVLGCEMATHVGGKYRWRWRNNENGQEFGFTGEMLEVALHSKLAHTQIFDPGDLGGSMGGEPSIITVTFNETNGITNVTTSIKYASKADRDAAMSTGMTDGMEMSYKQLDGVLAS